MSRAYGVQPVPGLLEISLCVFLPNGRDMGKARHMGLWFTYAEDPDNKQHAYSHAVSTEPGVYAAQRRINYDPRESKRLLKRVRFGYIRESMTPEDIAHWTTVVRFDGRNPEMNCQAWIFMVLENLKKDGLIDEETEKEGSDEVYKAIFEAPDFK